jgi:hypothetical protein
MPFLDILKQSGHFEIVQTILDSFKNVRTASKYPETALKLSGNDSFFKLSGNGIETTGAAPVVSTATGQAHAPYNFRLFSFYDTQRAAVL